MRARAAHRGKDLLAHRIVDRADLEPTALLDRNRDCEHREAVQEVGGAIERIDDPDDLAVAAATAFLGQERMRGIEFADDRDDLALGGLVDLADVVVAALGGDLETLQSYQAADDDLAGTACGAYRDIEQRMHGRH